MGKIADRLALKNDPLHAPARDIVLAARAYVRESLEPEFTDLANKLEEGLESLNADEFERLLGMVHDAAAPRQDSDDILGAVHEVLVPLCESLMPDDDVASGYLVSIPMVVESDVLAWNVGISPAQAKRVVRLMKDHDLVVEEAEVYVLPRLLGGQEADLLLHGEIFRITRLFAEGRMSEVKKLVDEARARAALTPHGAKPVSELQSISSICVLMAYVTCTDPEVFPLAMELDCALADVERLPGTLTHREAAADEAFTDVREVLEAAAKQMVPVLCLKNMQILEVPRDWYSGVAAARNLEREAESRIWLQELAVAHTNGETAGLCIDSTEKPDVTEASLDVRIYRKSDGKFLDTFSWVPHCQEYAEDCTDALDEFLGHVQMPTLVKSASAACVEAFGPGEFAAPASKVLH